MTEDVLYKEYQQDKELSQYDAVLLDEAHERSLATDDLLFSLKYLLNTKKRPQLRVVIMSAGANMNKFKEYFNKPLFENKNKARDSNINPNKKRLFIGEMVVLGESKPREPADKPGPYEKTPNSWIPYMEKNL